MVPIVWCLALAVAMASLAAPMTGITVRRACWLLLKVVAYVLPVVIVGRCLAADRSRVFIRASWIAAYIVLPPFCVLTGGAFSYVIDRAMILIYYEQAFDLSWEISHFCLN
ncbi:MAG: hypothetical protein PVJ57_21455 [Phycisphaerae bacterium]